MPLGEGDTRGRKILRLSAPLTSWLWGLQVVHSRRADYERKWHAREELQRDLAQALTES